MRGPWIGVAMVAVVAQTAIAAGCTAEIVALTAGPLDVPVIRVWSIAEP
ncbi:hypothetical protein WI460_14995 [Gemmatimonadota bacterium Y43]